SSLVGELAAEPRGERRALVLAGAEEQRAAGEHIAGRKHDVVEEPIRRAFQPLDALLAEGDAVLAQARAGFVRELAGPVCQEHDIVRPLLEHQREARALLAAAIDGEWLIAPFPSVA